MALTLLSHTPFRPYLPLSVSNCSEKSLKCPQEFIFSFSFSPFLFFPHFIFFSHWRAQRRGRQHLAAPLLACIAIQSSLRRTLISSSMPLNMRSLTLLCFMPPRRADVAAAVASRLLLDCYRRYGARAPGHLCAPMEAHGRVGDGVGRTAHAQQLAATVAPGGSGPWRRP